jgi:cell division protein FtsQ
MTMLDRRSRTGGDAPEPRRSLRFWRRKDSTPQEAPPASSGPDEETVRIDYAEVRKRRRNAGRWRLARRIVAVLLVAALVVGSVWVVYFSSLVTARGVEITGTRSLGESRIERVADVPTGTPLARLDLDAIRNRVESMGAVRRVAVSRSWPHTVHVAVTERTPIAVIDQGNGLKALDSEGVLFGSYRARPRGLPFVRTDPGTPNEALVEAGRVVAALPPRIAGKVATVAVTSVDKIQLVLRSGRRVEWGSAEDSENKAEVLAVLLKRPSQQIDVSVPGRPTTR